MSYFNNPHIYDDPLVYDWNEENEEITESIDIINNKISLTQIPDRFHKVKITNYIETTDTTPSSGFFYVNYQNGTVTFGGTIANGTSVSVHYFGRGRILIPANRISYSSTDSDTVSNLQNMLDKVNVNYKDPVATFTDIATTYPNPREGWSTQTTSDGKRYRYNGVEWVYIHQGVIPDDILDGSISFGKLDFEPVIKSDFDAFNTGIKNLNNFVNVIDCGAKLDGSDDTNALILAITRANNSVTPTGGWKRVVYIPGRMTIASGTKISIPNSITFKGNAFDNCAIIFTHQDGGFIVDKKDSNNNLLFTYELKFEHISLFGENICKTLLEGHRLANVRLKRVYIGGTTDFPFKLYEGGMVWIDECTLDGSYKDQSKVRSQRGFYLEDFNFIVCDNWNLWNLKEAFYLKGVATSLNFRKGNWVENVETLITVTEADNHRIDSFNVDIGDSYILNSSADQSYAWNLIRFDLGTDTLVDISDAFVRISNLKIYNVPGATFRNNCIIYMPNFNGTIYYDIEKINFAGITKPAGTVFVGMDEALQATSYKVRFYQFRGINQFTIPEAASNSGYAKNELIQMGGNFKYPIASGGIKCWGDYDDGIEGVLKYEPNSKTYVLYTGDNATTDWRLFANIITGTSSPSSSAKYVGQIYVDTTNKVYYGAVATGTGATDWKQLST